MQTGAGTVFHVLDPAPGDTLLVFGAGGVGLSAVMAAVSRGCAVLAVDPSAARRALAEELGATALDVGATLPRAGHAIDTTGRAEVIARAAGALGRRGTLALVGIGAKVELDLMALLANGTRIRGVIEGDAVPAELIPRLVDLHRQGRLPIEKLIAEYPFAEIETAARDAAAGRVVKPVLTFG